MKTFRVTPLITARVWVNERATRGYTTEGTLLCSVRPGIEDSRGWILGVEAMLPRGARAEYGMVGIQFVPGTLSQLQVEVGYSGIPGELYTNALAANLDEVRIGLPQEYASTVMESLVLRCQHRLPPGVLRIVDAAHGLVGSSPSLFDRLTTAAVELARLDATFIQDDDIAQTLRSILIG